MIFTTHTLPDGEIALQFDTQDEADDCYIMLMDAFPETVIFYDCFNGYYNALVFPPSSKDWT